MNLFNADWSRGIITHRADFMDHNPEDTREECAELREALIKQGIKVDPEPEIEITPTRETFPCWCWVETPRFNGRQPYQRDDDEAIAEAERRRRPGQFFRYWCDDLQARIDAAEAMDEFHAYDWIGCDERRADHPNGEGVLDCFAPNTKELSFGRPKHATAVGFMNALINFPVVCQGFGAMPEIMGTDWILPLKLEMLAEPEDWTAEEIREKSNDELYMPERMCQYLHRAGFDDQCGRFKDFVKHVAADAPGTAHAAAAFLSAFDELADAVENVDIHHTGKIDEALSRAYEALRDFHISLQAAQIAGTRATTQSSTFATVEDVERITRPIQVAAESAAEQSAIAANCGSELVEHRREKSTAARERQKTADPNPDAERARADRKKALDRVHRMVEGGKQIMAACRTVCKYFKPLSSRKNERGEYTEYAPLTTEDGEKMKPETLARYYRKKYNNQ